jgi:penicillin amidase
MRRPALLVRRVAWSIALICIVLAMGGWLLLRGSLPRYDGSVQSDRLTQAVTVERDALGTATLRGGSRNDVTWALGYVHAQERYFEMDLLRRRAAGELAELFGPVAVAVDRKARAHRMRARAQAEIAALPDEQRRLIENYRDGVNAGLAALTVRPFAYLLTRNAPAPWRSEDTWLVIAAMAFTLNDAENTRELAFIQMHAALPQSAFRLLDASGGSWDAPIAGAALPLPPLPTAAEFDLHALAAGSAPPSDTAVDRLPGSNSFAVAGPLAGGAALLANDMHLDLRVPSLWFRARLIFPNPRRAGQQVEVTGASLPGTPAIVAGSNGKIAWGFTNSYADTTDWVRVMRDPNDPHRYRSADGWTSISKHTEIIRVHGAADQTLEVEDTQWGPVIARDVDDVPLAIAWTAQEHGAFNVELQRLETAETADEAIAIAQVSGLPPQNFLVADHAGSIAWTIAGLLPRRIGGYDPHLSSDWSQPGTGWAGRLPVQEYPLVANPPWQRLWTANQRVVEGPALEKLGDGGYDLGARARQIRDDLRERDHFSAADMLAIQLDDRSLFLERWKDLLQLELDRAPHSPLHDKIAKALAGWNGHASTDAVGYRIVRAWRNAVVDEVLDGFAVAVKRRFPTFTMPRLAQAEHVVWKLVSERPLHLLGPAYADWDALLIACADRTASNLDAQEGGIDARTWGERNTAQIDHPLSRGLPAFAARWLDMPHEPLPGDSNMPRVQGPSFGASERFAVAPGDEAHGYFMMAGGQSGHPLSPYYGSGHSDWAAGKPTPFLPGVAQHTLTFLPSH